MVDGAMTDTKGDRRLTPSEQEDPDLFLHVVARSGRRYSDPGAKAHQTGAINSHEILVMPTQAMRQEDGDYAVCFAVPADAQGILYVYGRQSCDTRRLEGGTDDVGNCDVRRTGGGHRSSGCFRPMGAGLHVRRDRSSPGPGGDASPATTARATAAARGGRRRADRGRAGDRQDARDREGLHIKDKIVEMIHLNETMYACGIAASSEGQRTDSAPIWSTCCWPTSASST